MKHNPLIITATPDVTQDGDRKLNMVDERFELCAVIFRLAGASGYTDLELDYQKEVAETFAPFAGHRAVKYAKKIKICYDQVFRFAVHIEKKDGQFVFLEDIKSLMGKGWTPRTARKFLELLNAFYIDTNYAAFYESHLGLFEQASRTSVRTSIKSQPP